MELKQINDYKWEVPQTGAMRVPGLIYASKEMDGASCSSPTLNAI
jgi:tRNA-splicing ligase RtcB